MYIINIFIRAAKRLHNAWIEAADGRAYCQRFDLTRPFRQDVPVLISFEDNMYVVTDRDQKLVVARKSRLHYQLRGIEARRNHLRREYLIPENFFRLGDVLSIAAPISANFH